MAPRNSPRPPSRRRSRLGAGSARRTREENHARTAERGAAGEPLGAAHLRRRLHDDDRQPPVRLDAVRQPMHKAHGWAIADIQFAFSIFIALGNLVDAGRGLDRRSSGRASRAEAVVALSAACWSRIGWVHQRLRRHRSSCSISARRLSGMAPARIYATCVGNAVKWFPDRRGLAVGMTAAGFGAGAALTVIPIQLMIDTYGYGSAFFWFGLVQGVVVFVAGLAAARARAGRGADRGAARRCRSRRAATRRARCWRRRCSGCSTSCSSLVSASGLMATAQVALIAKDYGIADTVAPVRRHDADAWRWSSTTSCNGAARPFFGWVSDRIGREIHDGDRLQPGRASPTGCSARSAPAPGRS